MKLRLHVALLMVGAAWGCGGAAERFAASPAPASPTATPTPADTPWAHSEGEFRFVGLPEVAFDNGWFVTTVRVDRPLPRGSSGVEAILNVEGTIADVPGLQPVDGRRRCYFQDSELERPENLPEDGELVLVHLRVGGGAPVASARVQAQQIPSDSYGSWARRAAHRLACPRAPRENRCDDEANGAYRLIGIKAAGGGASCADAKAVMEEVAMWKPDGRRCPYELCFTRQWTDSGYRCTVAKVGEADWTITCRQGRKVVRGYTSD